MILTVLAATTHSKCQHFGVVGKLGEDSQVSSAVAFGHGHAVQTVRSVVWLG